MTVSCFNCGKYEQCQLKKDQVFCIHYELNPQTQKDDAYDKLLTNLRNCYDCYCEGCKYEHLLEPGNFVKCMNALIKESADAIETLQYELNPQTQKDDAYDKLYKALIDTSQNTEREFLNMQLGNVFGMPSSTDAERK